MPLTPAQVLRQYRHCITEYEQGEILEYKTIYYLGLGVAKIEAKSTDEMNYGFDDVRGDYFLIHHDQIAYRYEILPMLGRGAFGTVCKAFDHKTKSLVALKILRNKKNFHERGDMEVKILHFLNDQDVDGSYNIVKFNEGFIFRKHLVLSFELLGWNLYELLKKNHFTGLKLSLINRFAWQILQSLRLIKKVHIVHGDIRLENIVLVNN